MEYNFSIIIPHYNIPSLLKRCVDSIPFRDDVQIIVVDDCSSRTVDLLTTFHQLKSYKNLELYFTTQGGSAGRARNIGIDKAKGKWLIFADADDLFNENLSGELSRYLDAEEDVIYFNFQTVMNNDLSKISKRENSYKDFFLQYKFDHREDNFRFLYCTPWGKMIKRDLVSSYNIRFDETRYANDVIFSVLVGCKAKTILVVDSPVYILTEREGSLTDKFCSKSGETLVRTTVALRARQVIEENGFSFEYNYHIFIKNLLWNKEFNDLLMIYHKIKDYGLSRSTILGIVRRTGNRYLLICLWLIWKDFILTLQKK